ncbi:MAG: LacI family DNA-binding transcriptional regulator [Pseudomonadota bacterium]
MPHDKRSNLRDVAAHAGVSVATVSRVMNAPTSVKPKTRERVEAAMDALSFVPSAAARATSTGRTRMIGALVPTLDNAIFARVLEQMEHVLAEEGFSLVVSTTNGDKDREAERANALINIGAEGLIVAGIDHSERFNRIIARSKRPTIVISYFDAAFHLPTIGYDNAQVARDAMAYLTGLGHERIAILHGPTQTNDRTGARLRAIKADYDLPSFEAELSMAEGARLLHLALAQEPTALLSLSDVHAAGAVMECAKVGIAVPGDLSIMGIDDLPLSAHLHPALSTMHLPVGVMGRKAAKAVAAWVETGERPAAECLNYTLSARETTQAL